MRELGDIHDIAAVATYPIVCCDIKDVGSAFDSPLGGAHVITEIKKRFPDKYVIAYSGGSFGPEYQKALNFSDAFVRRGDTASEWVDSLDEAVRKVGDPVEYWIRLRAALLAGGVTAFDIFLLEDAFVASIEKKDEFILTKALRRTKRIEEGGDILEAVATSMIIVAKLAIHALA